MIYFTYLLLLFSSGIILAKWIDRADEINLKHLALSPLLGYLMPVLIVLMLSFFKIKISLLSVGIPWIFLCIVLLGFGHRALRTALKNFVGFYASQGKYSKAFILLLLMGIFGLLFNGLLASTRIGDGLAHWAPKSIDWIKNGDLIYSPELKSSLKIWLGYPLLHSLIIMVNVLLLPALPAYSINISDSVFFVGMLFSLLYFVRQLNYSILSSLIISFAACFFMRDHLSLLTSAYAEIDLAYLLVLSLGLLWNIDEGKHGNWCTAGLALGAMIITKNEGIIRAVLSLTFVQTILWRRLFSWKCYLLLLFPIVFLFGINKLAMFELSAANPYTQAMDFSLNYIIERIPFILKVAWYSLEWDGMFKSFWPYLYVFSAYFLILSNWERWPNVKILNLLVVIFMANFIFDHIPSMVAIPPTDPDLFGTYNVDPQVIAHHVVTRIHLHVAPLLSIVCALGFYQLWENDRYVLLRK